MGQQQDLNLQ